MGKNGKKTQAGKPKKLTPKNIGKRLDALVKKLEEELKGADIFVPLPPTEDCAICLVPLSRLLSETCYHACCGNEICKACAIEHDESIEKQNEKKNSGKKLAFTCPFCRELIPTSYGQESMRQLQSRCLLNDHHALYLVGHKHLVGGNGVPKDDLKSLDYFIRAVELGSPQACVHIGNRRAEGNGMAVNKERVALFQRVGALRGSLAARHNIGRIEYHTLTFGNHEIGIRHWKIAAEAGHQKSLHALRDIYNAGGSRPGKEFISKDYLDSAYRACHEAQMEVKSEEREKHRTLTHLSAK